MVRLPRIVNSWQFSQHFNGTSVCFCRDETSVCKQIPHTESDLFHQTSLIQKPSLNSSPDDTCWTKTAFSALFSDLALFLCSLKKLKHVFQAFHLFAPSCDWFPRKAAFLAFWWAPPSHNWGFSLSAEFKGSSPVISANEKISSVTLICSRAAVEV